MLTEIRDYTIRRAEECDLEALANILYRHYQSYEWWKAVYAEVEKTVWVHHNTHTLRHEPSNGGASQSFVIEDAGVLAGVACYTVMRSFDSNAMRDCMSGEDVVEAEKLNDSTFKNTLVQEYGEAVCG